MAEIFYPGQKDYIYQLNQLAGRGAVVSSYDPAVGKSPLGGPNGYMNPAWLDPEKPIYTTKPIALGMSGNNMYGLNLLHPGLPQQYLYKVATLPASSPSTHATLQVDGVIGGWNANSLTAVSVTMGVRDGLAIDWTTQRGIPTSVRFFLTQEANEDYSLYVFFLSNNYSQASLQIIATGATTYSDPSPVGSVPGTVVWDSASPKGTAGYFPPRQVGTGTNGMSFDSQMEVRSQGSSPVVSGIYGAMPYGSLAIGQQYEAARLSLSAQPSVNYEGRFSTYLSGGQFSSVHKEGFRMVTKAYDNNSGLESEELLSITGRGDVYMPLLKAGAKTTEAWHHIQMSTAQGQHVLFIGRTEGTSACVGINASSGLGGWSGNAAVLFVGMNDGTSRSMNLAGTVNAQGSDYAEYFVKSPSCGIVAPGQLVGINHLNEITDIWSESVMFAIKSTDPSFVGGDSWSQKLGQRPESKAGEKPVKANRTMPVMSAGLNPEDAPVVLTKGDTDTEWMEYEAAYLVKLQQWDAAVAQDKALQAEYDRNLESARACVDRIAIAGRVPVNVFGAKPGDYIVPAKDGDGIKGVAVSEDDMTLKQYLRAVGQVIKIEDDGRAYVMVKSV